MHLKALQIFCDVVRHRSFSRAANANEISQSSASQTVHQLEQRLGVRLIDRSKRPFVLTPEGEAYYAGCREMVERYLALEDRVRTLHDEVAGQVRVASIYSVGLHHMSRYLHEFLVDFPKANVRLEYQHPAKVYENVENDKADIGLVSYPRNSRAIEAVDWREERMVLACGSMHELSGRETISAADLDGLAFVGFDQHLTIRREIDRSLARRNVSVDVVMEFDNIETIKRAIEINAGVSILPEPTVVREVAAGTLAAVRLDDEDWVRPLGIIRRRGKELTATAQRFIESLQHESQPELLPESKQSAPKRAQRSSTRVTTNGSHGDTSNEVAKTASTESSVA